MVFSLLNGADVNYSCPPHKVHQLQIRYFCFLHNVHLIHEGFFMICCLQVNMKGSKHIQCCKVFAPPPLPFIQNKDDLL